MERERTEKTLKKIIDELEKYEKQKFAIYVKMLLRRKRNAK